MKASKIVEKALNSEFLNIDEGLYLYKNLPLPELMLIANILKNKYIGNNKVGWIIDRNVNITNVCISRCKFCNFHCIPKSEKAYITDIELYIIKIKELFYIGGDQILLQGGLHPKLDLNYYSQLFKQLKEVFPTLKLHALGPPEIFHIAKISGKSIDETLKILINSGLDSLPGAGAEILSNRVRKIISPGKCSADDWLNVMRVAHRLNLPTSATMMFGHIETVEERLQHLIYLRQVQSEKPADSYGFITFIPWPFQDKNTVLWEKFGVKNEVTPEEYIRMIAISRIMMPNIKNIQASWLTVGKETAQLCLHAGANDLGSIMIEENVVSQAGANYKMDAVGIQKAIIEAGFEPQRRNQKYEAVV